MLEAAKSGKLSGGDNTTTTSGPTEEDRDRPGGTSSPLPDSAGAGSAGVNPQEQAQTKTTVQVVNLADIDVLSDDGAKISKTIGTGSSSTPPSSENGSNPQSSSPIGSSIA